ncbi:MAG: hypothetical protein N2606_00430, partial [Candidatus Omnitrophica bacterium]|nr:hypothetical protein [Candidatus Omnitrophota bacterium]
MHQYYLWHFLQSDLAKPAIGLWQPETVQLVPVVVWNPASSDGTAGPPALLLFKYLKINSTAVI